MVVVVVQNIKRVDSGRCFSVSSDTMRLALVAFAVVLALLARTCSAQPPSPAVCPQSCADAARFCRDALRPTDETIAGAVTVGGCNASSDPGSAAASFSCVCNGVAAISFRRDGSGDSALCAAVASGNVSGAATVAPLEQGPLALAWRCTAATGLCLSRDVCDVAAAAATALREPAPRGSKAAAEAAVARGGSVLAALAAGCVAGTAGGGCAYDAAAAVAEFRCSACDGSVIVRTARFNTAGAPFECGTAFHPAPTPSRSCDSASQCSGHGCCAQSAGASAASCACFADWRNGFWAGDRCDRCEPGFDTSPGAATNCTTRKTATLVFFENLSKSLLSATLPFVFCVFFFLLLSAIRRRWASDEEMEPVDDCARLHVRVPQHPVRDADQFVFKSKEIPPRPARSIGMMRTRAKAREVAARASPGMSLETSRR